jgi:DNA-binding transcriptional MerR regulator
MTRSPKRSDEKSRSLTIGALSRATSIPAETLRTWERRYGSPMPERKRSGHRLYPVASVEQLRRVARLLGHGHRPGELLPLTTRELDKLLSLAEPSSLVSTLYSRSGEPGGEGLERSMAVMMRAAKDLDREALVGELRAYWIRMGPLEFLQHLAGPFMTPTNA